MSLEYRLHKDFDGTESGAIQCTRDGVVSIISASPENRDYRVYLEWLNERVDPEDPESALVGNQPEPAE